MTPCFFENNFSESESLFSIPIITAYQLVTIIPKAFGIVLSPQSAAVLILFRSTMKIKHTFSRIPLGLFMDKQYQIRFHFFLMMKDFKKRLNIISLPF